MNESQLLDDWIANYQVVQKQKHAQFLKAIKHEFTRRTQQQRRDRLNEINPHPPPKSLATQPDLSSCSGERSPFSTGLGAQLRKFNYSHYKERK